MELMEQAMSKRGQENAGEPDKEQAGEKGIEGCEQLALRGLQWVDGPHAAKDHGRIEKRVDPTEAFRKVIASNSHKEGDEDKE